MFFTAPDNSKAIESLTELLAAERERSARAEGQLDVVHEQLAIAQNNFEWARLRLNQIEAERAVLLEHAMKLPFTALALDRQTNRAPFGDTNIPGISFEDIGDDAARREGVDHG